METQLSCVHLGESQLVLSNLQLTENQESKAEIIDAFLGSYMDIPIESAEQCKDILNAMKLIFKITKCALAAFKRMELLEIEPLVGDTACQNRAIFLACLVKRYREGSELYKVIDQIQAAALKMLKKTQNIALQLNSAKTFSLYVSRNFTEFTLRKLISCEKLELTMPMEIIALVQSYLLTKIRHFQNITYMCKECGKNAAGFHEQTDFNKVVGIYPGVKIGIAKEIVNIAKEKLSKFACAFLRTVAENATDEVSRLMISSKNCRVINGREETPCFYSIRVMLQICRKNEIPLLLKIKKAPHSEENLSDPFDALIFVKACGTSSELALDSTGPEELDLTRPCIVIEGMRGGKGVFEESSDEYINRLLKHNLLHLIDMNAAQHSQYTKHLEIADIPAFSSSAMGWEALSKELLDDKNRLTELKERAVKYGCSPENQTLLRITHIFTDILEKELSECSHATKRFIVPTRK
jgi:hypothetical protein